ncbi:pheromone precursor Bbp1(1) [Schizophyllum fasciatum]
MDAFSTMFPELFPVDEGPDIGSLGDAAASPLPSEAGDADVLALLVDAEHYRDGGNTTAHGWCVVA